MEFIIGILLLAFLFGLVSRNKGDNLMDTLSSGCGVIIALVVLALFLLAIMAG
jgi:hypothetical protein